ncbi:MAG: 8-oxoguanine deaminase [Acidimicrobiia bacterium]|nr:8-oxoguanine deaminase [Acidimicrobiia bacterium]
MSTLLIKNAALLATMAGEEIPGGGLFARNGWIEQIGPTDSLPSEADEVVDCSDHVVIPGLVNTHHHFYQTLTRAMAQDSELFPWLVELYPIWARVTPDHVHASTVTALAELALSGCTTAFDHHYLWPAGTSVDQQVAASEDVGIRFHAARGSMSVGESAGGLPPDSVVEDENVILSDSQRVVDAFHDPEPGAMVQVVLAPCSPFSVSRDLMAESARLARDLGVRLHTHLAETRDEEEYCLERFGLRPVDYAESVGWLGEDVWYAHAVHLSDRDVEIMASTLTGAAHCPTSNMRLASGIAPLTRFLQLGVPVGLGVDGSASNDSSHLMAEARQALLLARLARSLDQSDEPMLTARQALQVATAGGAAVLGRSDIGTLEVGKAADLACFSAADVAMAGAADPLAGLVFTGPHRAEHVFVHGRRVVDGGNLVGLDMERHVARHRQLARALLD